ncbi:unnamed protein product [Lampetra fluviatilis]
MLSETRSERKLAGNFNHRHIDCNFCRHSARARAQECFSSQRRQRKRRRDAWGAPNGGGRIGGGPAPRARGTAPKARGRAPRARGRAHAQQVAERFERGWNRDERKTRTEQWPRRRRKGLGGQEDAPDTMSPSWRCCETEEREVGPARRRHGAADAADDGRCATWIVTMMSESNREAIMNVHGFPALIITGHGPSTAG